MPREPPDFEQLLGALRFCYKAKRDARKKITWVRPVVDRFDQCVSEAGDVPKSQIHALSRHRMQSVSCVSETQHPRVSTSKNRYNRQHLGCQLTARGIVYWQLCSHISGRFRFIREKVSEANLVGQGDVGQWREHACSARGLSVTAGSLQSPLHVMCVCPCTAWHSHRVQLLACLLCRLGTIIPHPCSLMVSWPCRISERFGPPAF